MRLSQSLFQTKREEPSDADVRSHAFLAKAGFLHKVASGIYVYGPLMHRVLRRIEAIVREEHDKAGCQEMLMPALQPRELWEESQRWARYCEDGILFHLEDRKGAELCLGPTHEEIVTDYVRSIVQSYKQLPFTLYQIQTKFRDEIRPRFGLMRGREFIMKDAYSFDASQEGMERSYQVMRDVYRAIFKRCGLSFTPVEADSGAIGGARSEEFMVDAETGEDAIALCRAHDYAANVEKAVGRISAAAEPVEEVAMHKEPTPGARSCDALVELFPDLPLTRMLKTVLYKASFDPAGLDEGAPTEQTIAVLARGDREVNEIKLSNHLGAIAVELADEGLVRKATGAEPGFAGPIGLADGVRLLADSSVEGVRGFLCGGNETDTHYLDVYFGRDLEQPETVELGMVQAGDTYVGEGGEGEYEIVRGIEVGHIFQLGTVYSEKLKATFAAENQKLEPMWMGCYGIGVSRVAASAIEQNHDGAGMIWPLPIAPYSVLIVQMKAGNEAQDDIAGKLYDGLASAGIAAMLDDRKKLSPGVKFKDADLVGIPLRIVVGRDAAEGQVEWQLRASDQREVIDWSEALQRARDAVTEARVPRL